MPNDFLSGLGLTGQNPDYNTPMQSELSAALMKALTTQQMNYDPNVRGGWTASMVNALRDINAGFYRNQALRTNQNVSQDYAGKRADQILGTQQQTQPTMLGRGSAPGTTGSINPGQNQGAGAPVKNTSVDPQQDTPLDMAPDDKQGQQDFTTITKNPWDALTIKNAVDEKAPYMNRPRDEANTQRIVFHGDVQEDVDKLLNYGRSVDKSRGFDPNYHYYIDRDGNISNGVPTDRVANHVGKYNDDSLGIVLAGVVGGKQPTQAQIDSATKLSSALADKYGLTQSNIIKHPELMPGHRTMDESGEVAPMIRKYGFDQSNWPAGPAEQNRIETAALPLNRKSIEAAKNVKLASAQTNDQPLDPRQSLARSGVANSITDPVPEIADPGARGDLTRRSVNPTWNVKPDNSATTTIPKMSNLGGPQDQNQGAGQNLSNQVAQNFAAPNGLEKGNLPNVRQLETPEELRALLHSPMVASDPKLMEDIISGYYARSNPQINKSPFGDIQTTPGVRGQTDPQSRMLPTDRESLLSIAGVGTTVYSATDPKTGQQGFKLKIPGPVGDKMFNSPQEAQSELEGLFGLARQGQQITAEGQATNELMKGKTEQVNEAVHKGIGASDVLKTLNTMDTIAKTAKGMPTGPTKDYMLKARELLANFTGKVPDGTSDAEVFEKLNGYLASIATKAITNRGTNFDLQTFMRTNPSLFSTNKGTQQLIDIMRQEYEATQDLGSMASKVQAKDVNGWPDVVSKYQKEHPIRFDMNVNGKSVRVNTSPVKKEEDLANIQSGEHFIGPDGQVRVKK